jgi:sucrose-6F-phosphate phosphohydrolase
LLATDLDGTFIGDDREMARLWQDIEDAGILLAFSTGRHLPSIEEFYADAGTDRRADACVCMVGTEIWLRESDRYFLDDTWSDLIDESWDERTVRAVARGITRVVPQPAEWQSPFKCSYFLEEHAEATLQEIERRLAETHTEAKILYSAGRYLDLLPIRSGKGEAVRHLAVSLGVAPGDVVTAGDTGNDLDMMNPDLGFRSIAVGNATPDLLDHLAPSVYRATAPYAAGIREGLEHFGWLPGHA